MESKPMINEEIISIVIKCVDFAARKHKDQRRKDPEKTPYINHPIGKIWIIIFFTIIIRVQ